MMKTANIFKILKNYAWIAYAIINAIDVKIYIMVVLKIAKITLTGMSSTQKT